MEFSDLYLKRAEQFHREVKELDKTVRQFAIGRLVVALAIIALFYFGFTYSFLFYPIPLLIVVFFMLVQRQLKKENERKIVLHLVDLNLWEADASKWDFKNFPDGERFVDPHHPFSHDLDVFGQGSLFQYLNRCATKLGEDRLAEDLTELKFTKETVLQRQEAIRDLGPMIDFRQNCWAIGKQIHDASFNLDQLRSWLKQSSLFHKRKTFLILRWGLPIVTLLSLFGNAFNPIFQSVFLFLFLSQLAITSLYGKPITKLQNELSVFRIILENYSLLFKQVKSQEFSSVMMKRHHQVAVEATDHVKKFSSLINALESRMNLIARIFGNGLFMYDIHCVSNLEEWREHHALSLPQWIESLAEWDALLSFATFHFNHSHYAFAEIYEALSIRGNDAGHPLISSSVRVNNDFDLGNPAGLMLITGANMAGKSTFLRAIGVNYLLASNGSPVCASRWSSPLISLRTGMRTSDSLQEHQSYFYAELHRLQSIIEELRAEKPMLILLDEILKGTNSTDKQAGSRELIKQLIQHKALVLIATHDIALGDMEQEYPSHVVNTCFEGKIEKDQLTFDYKLNKGLAQKANATFLMRKMGIIPA